MYRSVNAISRQKEFTRQYFDLCQDRPVTKPQRTETRPEQSSGRKLGASPLHVVYTRMGQEGLKGLVIIHAK